MHERSLLMVELQERGVEVAAEEDVSAGLRRISLEGLSPDVIVWDASLGPPGPRESDAIRQSVPQVRFVVLARPSVELDERRWPVGSVFVERPVSVGALAEAVQRILSER
jgi:hypothetical protein